ncbi:hypothetical protein [Nocardia brasiliensis]|uniref:hypothetical protein n=1 Tax=Nocardia brasiliensis TaxID=37326 RepID=UPI0024572E13|nr:hypothetical protein [Nocardia brasiliensis]
MALNFKLGPRREVTDTCVWNRNWVGWEHGQSDQRTYTQNRGVWNLNHKRAARERYATFSVDGVVVTVVELDSDSPIDDIALHAGGVKQAIRGRVLGPGDLGYDTFHGRAVDRHRTPVTYLPDDPDAGPSSCACGCGAAVTEGRAFVIGHDQKALHTRIQEGWGDVAAFVRWYDHEHRRTPETPLTGAWRMHK